MAMPSTRLAILTIDTHYCYTTVIKDDTNSYIHRDLHIT